MRNHNAFTSGNLISEPAWGSTNCYTEDANGNPIYDFSVNDRVYDTFLEGNCKPMIELAFMPHQLSAHPETGPKESWRYPPKDCKRWRDLVSEFATHLISRYGKEEVRTWYFSTWNEPDIDYFKWKPDENLRQADQRRARAQEYFKVHDYSCDGIWRVDEELHVGGPDLAAWPRFLDAFLNHIENEPNYVTGKRGDVQFLSRSDRPQSGRPLAPLPARRAYRPEGRAYASERGGAYTIWRGDTS